MRESNGGAGREQRAREKGEYILQNHKAPPLPADVEAEIDAILKRGPSTKHYTGGYKNAAGIGRGYHLAVSSFSPRCLMSFKAARVLSGSGGTW